MSTIAAPGLELEVQALTLQQQAAAVRIVNDVTYQHAADLLKGIKALRNEAETHHRPMIDAAHKAWKATLAGLQDIDEPLKAAEAEIKRKVGAYEIDQRRKAEDERRKMEAEVTRQREEAARAAAEQARAEKATEAEVKAVTDQAMQMPLIVPKVEPKFEKAEGVSSRLSYKAEVTDMLALVQHVAGNPSLLGLLKINEPALNAMARTQGATLQIPGVRVVGTPIVSVRA